MRVLIFSDIHGDLRALSRILEQPADLYIAAGDLATFGKGLDRCGEVLGPLGSQLWVLPGNHETHEDTRALCARFGFIDFHRQLRSVEGARGRAQWAGLGYSNITPFHTPGEYSEEQIAEALVAFDKIPSLYLVAHCPPRDSTLDEFAPGQHGGSSSLRAWMDRAQPRYLFCGHIHEAAGLSERIGSTECFNVGKQGYIIEV
ncbi:MAG TPA: metallophosphoesterase [Candidatus Acidoferrales bacterium]|nr:metallophosphoesterase [Candidatus Acidoferrales bacterium]